MRTPASLQFARGRGLKTKRAPLKYRGELLALGCRRLFHWPRAPNQLFHVSCSCGSTLRAFPSCNIARAASLRQSTATRDFRSLPVNGATLESSLSSPIAYCCSPVKSSSRGSSSVNEVGESSPYIGPLVQGRGAFRRGCWNVGKAATAHAWHFASSRREEPGEETRLEDPRGEITRNSEEIDKNGYCATSERKNVLFGTDRIIVEGFEEKDDWTYKRKIILKIRTFSFLSSQDSHLPEERQKFYENVKSSSWNPFSLTVKKQKKGARSKRSKRVGKKSRDSGSERAKIPRTQTLRHRTYGSLPCDNFRWQYIN